MRRAGARRKSGLVFDARPSHATASGSPAGGAMAAEIHVFRCLEDNIGALVHDPATGACAAIDAPEEGAVLAALEETRLEADRHPRHPPAPRPCRRHPGPQGPHRLPRRRAREGRRPGAGGRRPRARGRHGPGRGARGRGLGDAGPLRRPRLLLVRGRPGAVRRRHPVHARLRAGAGGLAMRISGIRCSASRRCRTRPTCIPGTITCSRTPASRSRPIRRTRP